MLSFKWHGVASLQPRVLCVVVCAMHSSAVAGVLLLHELFTSPTLPAIHLYHHRHQMVSAK